MLLGIMYVLEDMAGWQDIALKALPVFGVEDGLCGQFGLADAHLLVGRNLSLNINFYSFPMKILIKLLFHLSFHNLFQFIASQSHYYKMPMYNMCLTFDIDCNFIFEDWHSTTDLGFTLGVVLSFLFAFMSIGFSTFKQKFAKKTSPKVEKVGTFLIGYLLKLITMFLIMTMNFFVCMAMVFGMTFGQIFFDRMKKNMKARRQQIFN